MKSLHKVILPLLLTVAAFGLSSRVTKADNPITKPNWKLPQSGDSSATSRGSMANCNNNLQDGASGYSTFLNFGDCFSQNTLLVRLTGAPVGAHPPNSMMYFLENIVQTKLLQAVNTSGVGTPLFSNFLDLTLKRFLDGDTSTTLDYDANTYLYQPVTSAVGPYPGQVGCTSLGANGCSIGTGGYDPSPLLDRTCIDIPLVGSVCLNGYLYDIENEAGSVFFRYNTTSRPPTFTLRPQANADVEANHMTGTLCDTSLAAGGAAFSPCGNRGNLGSANYRDDDDGLEVKLVLNNVTLDLFFEPPTDATLTDIANSSANYVPENDLSTYLKAYGRAELGTVQLTLNLRIAANYNDGIQPHSIAIGFELQDVLFDSDFQFVFKKGPYCNNNLGTTDTSFAGMTPDPVDATLRPFGATGVRNYAGLVSDTSGAGFAGVLRGGGNYLTYVGTAGKYRPLATGVFPRTGATGGGATGGSGVGRDRIGVNASPYQYSFNANESLARYSDNPNNCKRPADTCTLTVANGGVVIDGGVEWTGPSASCEGSSSLDPISNNSDDSTYKISEQITSIIPYIQGEIKVTAQDKFKNRSRGNPGYYLGPTSLLDLGSTLAGISFDWPLRPGTDYVFIDALLSSDVDRDSTNEFWADPYGVMVPFNFAMGVSWNSVPGITAAVNKRLDTNACVQKLTSITGYKDGFGEFVAGGFVTRAVETIGPVQGSQTQDNDDDPFLTRTRHTKGVAPAGSTRSFLGILNGFAMPQVTWPTLKPAAVVPDTLENGSTAYGVGLAIHQNVLSGALYDAVVKGLLCADIDSTGQYAKVTDQIGGEGVADLLNTSTFQFFFPALYDKYPDRPMRVRVIPLLKRYSHNGAGNAANGIASFAVTSVVNEPRGGLANRLQVGAEAPYVIMGGPPIQMSLAFNTDSTGAFLQSRYMWPDMSIVIPNLLVEFYVYGKTASDNNWYRVFAIDMGVLVGLNIDIVKFPATYSNLITVENGNKATWYPIGCNPPAPNGSGPAVNSGLPDACSGGFAYTKRVLRLAGLADPEINAIIEYSELSFGNPNGTQSSANQICGGGAANGGQPTEPGTTPCNTGGKSERPVSNAFSDPAVLKGAMSNLIGLALSLDLSALVEVGFDLGAFLNLPIVIDAPYIGPSFAVDSAGGVTNATDREQPTPNGFGDYLVAGLSFDLNALNSSYLIQQLDYLLDGTDATKPFGLDIDVGLAPGEAALNLPPVIPVPQATVQAPLKVSAQETIFRFSGHDAADGKNVQYSWRVDNGVWTLFSEADSARIVGLLEGKHTFEVKALNSQGMMQDVPSRYTFVVDSIAPKIRVVGDRTVGSRASFFVEANDWLTPKEDIRIAYQIDNGSWSNFGYNKKISVSGLKEGRHTLRVKAADNAGNNGETAFNFSASDGGFGCSTTSGAGSLADVLVMLVIPALVILRKRLF